MVSDIADDDQRIARLRLAQVRQELLAPVSALVGYAQILRETSAQPEFEPFTADIDRIEEGASTLRTAVDQLLDTQAAQDLSAGHDVDAVQRTLRHDLRSPMNAIKGYAEMLMEDLGESSLEPDLNSLIKETDRLLEQLPAIVDFSQADRARVTDSVADTAMYAELARNIEPISARAGAVAHVGHILVVDDMEANRSLLARRLQREGHTAEVAASGRAALQAVSSRHFDLILLDVMMPEMNGFDVLSRLKSDPATRDIAVLMVSALEEADSVIRCIEGGAEDYLQKPVDPVLLRARIGACIEKARLREEASRLLERLEREVQEARALQLNMVPTEFPQASESCPIDLHAFMEPAREVGGDFYDYVILDDSLVYALVGDVADKGVGAGMFMARARSLIRAVAVQWHAATGEAPGAAAVLNRVNPELCDSNPDMNFVTVLLVRLEARTGELTWASAGHSAPVRVRPDAAMSLIGACGPPMGIDDGIAYNEQSDRLAEGESLFLCTDGVTEATNGTGELYGEERLDELLNLAGPRSANGLTEHVLEHLRGFVGEALPADDITLLTLRRTGPGA